MEQPTDLMTAPTGACERCNKRPATSWWTGHASELDVARGHGGPRAWCAPCCTLEQLEYVRDLIVLTPERLLVLGAEDPEIEALSRDLDARLEKVIAAYDKS